MVLGILLIVLGLLVVGLAGAWRSGHLLDSARMVMQWVSPAMVIATPAAGLMVAFVGLMLIWPPAVVFAFACAIGWVAVLVLSTRNGIEGRLPAGLRQPEAPVTRSRDIRTAPGTPPATSTPRRQAR